MSKRAERRRRTALVVLRRKEVLKWTGLDMSIWREDGPFLAVWAWDRSITWEDFCDRRDAAILGRCKDRHPLDCGHSRCGVCSWGKRVNAGITRQEIRFHDSADYQMDDFFLKELNRRVVRCTIDLDKREIFRYYTV